MTFIVAGNWKMNLSRKQSVEFFHGFPSHPFSCEMVLFPQAPLLEVIRPHCQTFGIKYGSQNCGTDIKGAFTGEISVNLLKEIGCTYALLGHSERRQLFGETDKMIAQKAHLAQEAGLIPMICIGETFEERQKGLTADVLKTQLETSISKVDPSKPLTIAYEPVWAIGTGQVATPDIAVQSHQQIRDLLEKLWGRSLAEGIPILYGGSVKPDNARALATFNEINGFLVGGASLDAKDFLKIVEASGHRRPSKIL